MKPLSNDPPRPDAKPDGERADEGWYCHACPGNTPPLTWLQGQVYCRDCYPKMVAVLEADEKLAMLKTPACNCSPESGWPHASTCPKSTN